MEYLEQVLLAIIPSVGVGFLFYKVIKTIVESDRSEWLAYAQWQQRQDAAEKSDATDGTGVAESSSTTPRS